MSCRQRNEHKELRQLRRIWKLNFKNPPDSIDAMRALLTLKATCGGVVLVKLKCTRPNKMGIITGINND